MQSKILQWQADLVKMLKKIHSLSPHHRVTSVIDRAATTENEIRCK